MQFTIRQDILIADDFWDLELNQKCIEYFETARSSGLTATSEQVAGNINANGNIVGIELRLNVKSWKRKEGGKSNAPVLSIQVEPNVNSGNENQIPFPKESETGNNMSNDDIPF